MRSLNRQVIFLVVSSSLIGSIVGIAPADDARRAIEYERDVRPILTERCVKCHGPRTQKSGLRLDSARAAIAGGNSGPALEPRDGASSLLIQAVTGADGVSKMPPAGERALTAEQILLLKFWIDQGAKGPASEAAETIERNRSEHWAYQPNARPAPAESTDRNWIRNPIDTFVLAKLEREGVAPSPEADRVTLIRRLSLDLIGLPPSLAEMEAFINDSSPDSYERLVDRLLASPHYGERWGRHWLDLARYADSDGYEKDTGRPFAWRYRQWVIDALNRDLPFDRFTIEQLAGDLLPDATLEQKIATGFHRNTLTNREGGVDPEEFRVEAVVDRVNTTGAVWLGTTIGCCRCHDHKYDPFSQREFYRLFAFFNSDLETDVPVPPAPEELEVYSRLKAAYDKKEQELLAPVKAYAKTELPLAQQKWEEQLTLAELRMLPEGIRTVLLTESQARTEQARQELTGYYGKLDEKFVALNEELKVHRRQKLAEPSFAMTLSMGQARATHVLIRGDFLRPGVEVTPGLPGVLSTTTADATSTRLDLARWLVDPTNPLTARVISNWVWHYYFGRGIVATLEDFGTQGEKPSHPELLDRLATDFIDGNWSLKQLHRRIVTSATYRQSSDVRPDLSERDPLNVWLARQSRFRVEADVIRDLALASSGLLQPKVGGPSVRPPQPADTAKLTYDDHARWVESTGADRYRRGLYTWFQRTSPYPMLMTFDSPDAIVCCVRRQTSDTPLQALTLLNNPVFVESARSLAWRIVTERPNGDAQHRIRHGFRLCLSRDPSSVEVKRLKMLFDEFRTACESDGRLAAEFAGPRSLFAPKPGELAAWTGLARTLFNLDEFVTRE